MALKLFVVDDITGTCDLRGLVPYTGVTSNDASVVVTQSVGPDGQPLYDLSATVDVNVSNLTYDPVTKEITLTETDGDSYTIDVSDLVDTETITTLLPNGMNGLVYTNEAGDTTTINPSSVEQIVTGNIIATHTSGNGTVVDIQETITSFLDLGNGSIQYIDESGGTAVVSICDLISNVGDTGQFIGG